MHRPRSMAPLTSPIMLLVFVIISLAAGRLGAAIAKPALETWYAGLRKPAWTPPNIFFPVAWSLIFLAIGISAGLVWNSAEPGEARLPPTLFSGPPVFPVVGSFSSFGHSNP